MTRNRENIQDEKSLVFCRAAFSYSAVQTSFDINFPWSLGFIKKLAFGSPWGNYFTPGLSSANRRRPGILNLHRHRHSGYHFPPLSLLGQCRIRTTDLLIFSRTRCNWTNAFRGTRNKFKLEGQKERKKWSIWIYWDVCRYWI